MELQVNSRVLFVKFLNSSDKEDIFKLGLQALYTCSLTQIRAFTSQRDHRVTRPVMWNQRLETTLG